MEYYCSRVVVVVDVVVEQEEVVVLAEKKRGHYYYYGHIDSRVRLLPPSWGSWPFGTRHIGRG